MLSPTEELGFKPNPFKWNHGSSIEMLSGLTSFMTVKRIQYLLWWELLTCLMWSAVFIVSCPPSFSRLPGSWFLTYIPRSFSLKCFPSVWVRFTDFPYCLAHNVACIHYLWQVYLVKCALPEDNLPLLRYLINTFYVSVQLLL